MRFLHVGLSPGTLEATFGVLGKVLGILRGILGTVYVCICTIWFSSFPLFFKL